MFLNIKKICGKKLQFIIVAAILAIGGFFVYNFAFAGGGVTITSPAVGASNVSIDTTSATGGTSTFIDLDGPALAENTAGNITVGIHTLTLPTGWKFDTESSIVIAKTGGLTLASAIVVPELHSFSFEVTHISTSPATIIFSGLRVVPDGIVPGSREITYSGVGMGEISGSWGTLSTVAGTVTKLTFETQPKDTVYGSVITPNPTVVTQDQFGNNSTNGLGANLDVTVAKTAGTGALVGTATLDIGTGVGNGIVTFADLTVNEFGTGKQLTASATGLTNAVSDNFEITKKLLTATITADNKVYDGLTSATITGRTLVGLEFGDVVTVTGGTATFDTKDVGTSKVVSATGLVLGSEPVAVNYIFNGEATGAANITPKPITVTADSQTKVYGGGDPAFTFAITAGELVSGESLGGALARATGEDIADYAINIGTLQTANPNYAITFVGANLTITPKSLTVTATGVNKEYDAGTTATVNL